MGKTYLQDVCGGNIIVTSDPEAWASNVNYKRVSAAIGKAGLAAESKAYLLSILNPGAKVYCFLRRVSASGMRRSIAFFTVLGGELRDITGHVGHVLDYRHHDGGLVVTGCGMDMGFDVVYNLGRALWPSGLGDSGYKLKSVWM